MRMPYAMGCCGWIAALLPGICAAQSVSLDNVSPIALTTSSTLMALQLDHVTGNVLIRTAAGNYEQCTTPGPSLITAFFPSSSTVSASGTITLNWSSTATSCTPQLGSGTIWSSLGTLPPSGSQNLTAPATPGTVSFQLNCTNGAQNDTRTTQVTVEPGAACPPTYPNGTSVIWNVIFDSWPNFGALRRLNVLGGYLALAFTAPAASQQFGTFRGTTHPDDGDGEAILSISRDPGCFDAASLPPNCLSVPSRFPSVSWKQSQGAFQCVLQGGQTYYINISYGTNTLPGAGPYCPAGFGSCSHDFGNIQQD